MKIIILLCVILGWFTPARAQFSQTEIQVLHQVVADYIAGTIGGGHTIEDDGTPLTQRSNMNFAGAGVTCADSGGKTVCTIPGGSSTFADIASGTSTSDAFVVGNGSTLSATGTGTIEATSVTSADLVALEALSSTGIAVRSASNTWVQRTITGTTNKITVTNGDGVSGNPTLTTGSLVVHTDQANTYSTGAQDFGSATSLEVPNSAGASCSTNAFICYDSTAHTFEGGLNSANVTFFTSGNLPTALAANGSNTTAATGAFAVGVDASGNAEGAQVALSGSAAPSAGTAVFPGQIYKDTRSFTCGVQGYTYIGAAASGDFSEIFSEGDGYTTFTDGVLTFSPCGYDTVRFSGYNGVSFEAYNKTADFTNQPSNDGWEAVSSNAGDTTQYLRVCGTLNGSNERDVTCETIQLNGTTQIASVTTTYEDIFTVKICSASTCAATTTAAGTVTLREASGNATITTIAAGSSRAATQDMYVVSLTATMDINGLTTDNAVDNAADYVPYYDAGEAANNKTLLENLGPRKVYWDAGAVTPDGTNCTAATEQTLPSGGGPKTWALSCADSGSSVMYGKIQLPVAISTATFTLSLYHATTEAITFAGDFSAMCRADGVALDNTWGTGVAADVSITTADRIEQQTTAAVTPNGTCSKGAMLFWRYVVDAANFSTNAANSKVLSVVMNY